MVKTSPSNAGMQVQSLVTARKPKHIKQKHYFNKFNEDFKNGPHQKKKKKPRDAREAKRSVTK